ncbi:MAG: M15 family metallopeptidase [Rhizobiaceae bacterium]|nr:M15 family metallopeptidase [Rhizobiaceae bacterium]
MEGLSEGKGNLAGIRLRSQFAREFLQWDGRNGGDPQAFEAFLQSFIEANVPADSNPHFLKGLSPHIETLLGEGYEQFTKDSASAVYGDGLTTDSAQLTETIRLYHEDGQTRPGGTDYESVWTHVLAIRDEALNRGTLASDIDAYLVDTIILNAERTRDAGLLAILDKTLPDQEHPMSYGLEVQKKRDAAAERIANALAKQEADDATAREKAEAKLAGQAYAEIASIWAKDIRQEIPDEVIDDLSKLDPMARSKLVDLRKKLSEADGVEDKATIARIFADIHEGRANKADILQHFQNGTIRSTETLNQALDRVDKIEAERSAGSGILTDSTARKWHSLFEGLTSSDPVSPFGSSGPSDEGMEAIHDFNMALLEWERENPDATFLDRQEAYARIGKLIRERIELPSGLTRGGEYISDADRAASDRPQEDPSSAEPPSAGSDEIPDAAGDQDETGWLDQVPNPISSARSLIETLAGSDEQPADAPSSPPLEELPDDQRKAVETLSQRHGMDPETVKDDLWRKVQEILAREEPEPGVDHATTNAIPDDVRDRLTQLLTNPPRLPNDAGSHIPTSSILDLIGRSEGTDRGDGYNETLSYGAFTGGDVSLVGMTLDEVDALQTQMLRHPDNSWNSSAAGRYQIVRTTLRKLRGELGLTGNELFDEKMQDRMAMHLLEGRGLSRWKAGEITDKQFINNLAKEWASLPNAKGRGHYKGQRAAATPRQVLAALHAGPPGHRSATLPVLDTPAPEGTPAAYAKIPDIDGSGRSGQVAKFIEWNSDPVANHEANLQSISPGLAEVVRLAQTLTDVRFVVGSGKRDEILQAKAIEWGWSKTEDSDHLRGDAVDLWPLDDEGAVNFSEDAQAELVRAMKEAAKQLGVSLDIGAEWKRFRDKPHFALKAA